jgi:quercetin 2,3-dioxygenase
MIKIRKATERGHANYGWLDTWHTFSFNTYYDPAYMGFRSLRVTNEDRVQPGQGFGTHGHQDMEIISYVLEGELEHRDTLGTGSVIPSGEFQRMSAGTGVQHSEFNPSETALVNFYQIWLLPSQKGLRPGYEQRAFSKDEKQGRWLLIASPDDDGSLTIHQDVRLLLSSIDEGQQLSYPVLHGRHAWILVVRGSVHANGELLTTSDGAAVSGIPELNFDCLEAAEVMLFDLA